MESNVNCTSCSYKTKSECISFMPLYCAPATCNICNRLFDVNTEFCGEPEEINKCTHCGGYDYTRWDLKKRPCPKCGEKMVVEGDGFFEDI